MIVYASRTGNVESIIKKIDSNNPFKISKNLFISEPYFLFTYTDGLGDIPQEVLTFLNENNHAEKCIGLFCSGNKNFGSNFAKAADKINGKFGIPILAKVELRGFPSEILKIKEIVKEYEINGNYPKSILSNVK